MQHAGRCQGGRSFLSYYKRRKVLTLQQFDMFREVSLVSCARWSMPSSEMSSQPESTTLFRLGICDRLASSSSETLLQALTSRCCSAGNLYNPPHLKRHPHDQHGPSELGICCMHRDSTVLTKAGDCLLQADDLRPQV